MGYQNFPNEKAKPIYIFAFFLLNKIQIVVKH